jgi:ribosomal protein S18 acetylase RimI-like enzyme
MGVILMAGTEELKIRPMERSDIDAMMAVYSKIRDEKIPGVKRSRLSYRGAMTFDEVASTNPGGPLDLSCVAEVDGDEVGIIHMLIVDPAFQKQGIATKLVDALAKRCKERGIKTVRAVIDERHWELQNYFQKLGFKRSELVVYTRKAKD